MSNAMNIFGGFYYLSLYDATNSWKHLTQAVQASVNDKTRANPTIEGQIRVYSTEHKLTVTISESDQNLLDALLDRVDTKQTLYLVGMDHALVVDNVYINPYAKRVDKGHTIILEASTNINSDVVHKVNFVTNPGMESYTGSMADNWNESGSTNTYSIVTSFRSGYAQRMEFQVANSDVFYTDNITMPIRDGQAVATSVYVKSSSGNTDDIDIVLKLELLADDGSTVSQTFTSSDFNLDPGESIRVTVSGTASLSAGQCSYLKLSIQLGATSNDGTIDIDDAQIELGKLSDYRAY